MPSRCIPVSTFTQAGASDPFIIATCSFACTISIRPCDPANAQASSVVTPSSTSTGLRIPASRSTSPSSTVATPNIGARSCNDFATCKIP